MKKPFARVKQFVIFLGFVAVFALKVSTVKAAIIVEFSTNVGSFNVELFDVKKPISVNNFMRYVNGNLYDQTIIHRSEANFVIQGGGYRTDLDPISEFDTIADEPGISNLRGTLGVAKFASASGSGTAQWYFNVVDNPYLDLPQFGEFTVFGRVLGDGMAVVDLINSFQTVRAGSVIPSLPLIDPSQGITPGNLVVVNTISVVPEPCSLVLLSMAGGILMFARKNSVIHRI